MQIKIKPNDLTKVDRALDVNSLRELAERYKNHSDSPLTFCFNQRYLDRCPNCGVLLE